MKDVLKKINKANFHLHLNGALSCDDLRYLSGLLNFKINDLEPLEQHLNFYDDVLWNLAKKITSTPEGLYQSIVLVLIRERSINVVYVELIINVFGMAKRGMSKRQMIQVLKKAYTFGLSIGVRLKVKFGINRKDGVKSIKTVVGFFNFCPAYLKATVDLNGNERKYPTTIFVESLKKISSSGIPVSLHLGEFAGLYKSFREAMSINPTRIAHAVSCPRDTSFLRLLKKKKIIVEILLTSNIKTGSVKDLYQHPAYFFIKNNIPVVLGTDDPVYFKNTMVNEFQALLDIGFSLDDVLLLNNQMLSLSESW